MAGKGLRDKMSNFGQSELDLSFLQEGEANRILEVLERDERLRRTEQERLSKLKSWKRDVKWLHAVSGEWFEEIQKKKFKDDPDVRSLVGPPLNHRLKKKTPKGEPESSRMTTSRNLQSPKNPGPSFLGLRSPFSSLFSFRKSAKKTLKPPSPHERHGIFSISGQIPPDTKVDRKFDIYHSTRNVKQIASFFEEQLNRARENDTTKATNQLEREVFQVLGDLDQKLAQEESHNRTPRISRLANCTYGRQYSKEGLLHNTAEPKNVYGCLPSHDGRRSGPPEGTHTTYATYQPRKFYEMYSNRQRRVSKSEASDKSFYNKSPSLFSAVSNITPRSSPVSGSFSTSSLQPSSPGLHLERIRQNKSRRTPIASIKWNNSFPSGHPEGIGRPFRTQSTLDHTNLEKPNHLYKYKIVPGLPVSTSNDLHESRNIKNLTNTTCMNIVDNRSTGYDITDSPEVIFSTQPERHWEEDYKKNYFNKNEMSKAPNDNSGSSEMETEPMELESDLSVQLDASSVANEEPSIHEGDIPVDCTLHNPEPLEVSSIHISEPENMDIDAPNVFLNSINSSTSTVALGPSAQEDNVPPKTEAPGLALADHNLSLDTIKKFSSFKHGTVYKVDTSSFTNPKSSEISDHVNKSDHKSSSLSGNSTDVGGKFAWMNMRRGLNNHTEGFRSDALKFQKRNASSLPDLLDQDSEIVANNSDVKLHKRTCENVFECGATTVPAIQSSSRISCDSNELHLENNSKYVQPCVQNQIPQKLKNLSTRNDQYLQKPNMFSDRSIVDGAFKNLDRTATFPAVPYEAESLTKKSNHTGFLSDTLKYKKRNASSLSDLLDQESDIFGNDPENILRKNGCGHDGDYHTSTVLETRSSRIPDERKERYLESSTRYEQSVQDTNRQPKISTSSTWQSIQRVSPFFRGSDLYCSSIQTEKRTTESEVAYWADKMTENNKVKNLSHLTETTQFSHVHAKYKSVNFNRSQYNGSDSNNNNTQLIGGMQTSDILNKDKSIIERGYIHQKQDHPEKEQVKSSKCDTSSKPNLSSVYQKDVASSPNQKNTDQNRQVEQGCESEGNLNQNFIYQLDQEANNKAEYTDPPKIGDSSRFPVSHSAKECSEEDNFSRATHLHNIESQSTNLLKQHLFVAPEPFKGNVRVSVIPKSEWKNSTSSEDSQSPTHQEGENIKNFDSEYKASKEDLQPHKTYTCQQIVENAEIYESLTDISYPEVDKIEYRKVVSVYYSFPHKFARRISDLSKNNLKNIDKTLQQSRAPSALLDIIGRCHKEEPDFNLLSSKDVKTSITEAVHSVEDVPSKTHHLNFHIIPLQTDLLKNGSRTNSGEENDDLVNKFSSLHISENEDNHKAREDPKNKNKYSPSGSSPRYSPNSCYFTLPNRKSSLQDLERNVLKRDIAMALDRINIYPGSRNMEPSPPEFQDVFASPTACYDNLNYSPRYDFMHFQESSKQEYNVNNIFARDGGLYKKNSMDEGIILREDLPSIYKSKSYKDLSQHKSYNTEDISPHTDCNTSPQTDYNHPAFSSVINQARPSYCSEFVQKKMKPINAKKFSFSVDRSSQESVSPRHTGSYDDTVQLFDGNSPSVFHSPNNNYPSHADKYFGQAKLKDGGNSNLYRSKSMKVLNTEGQQSFVDYKRKSDGSFSSKSYGGTLKSKSPSGKTWNRTSSAEILDENDNWPVSDERKALCTTKSFDYGIFGKEQQEAIVNNVKRSLTEGRLWRPSFLKNPGFLRTEELCSSQEINPVGQTPEESSSQRPNVKESLNIYEDVHVVPSDSDTETTTEDEYYLDEYYFNDKESEL
ncbi:exophilin-5 [Bufo bufo]|uniref:exophilin-5 n=1 Tax=Bufo bufo TaxID=8384 RepID=UPI001ABE2BA0|nr:exophilin-5 [Bufo bufo]